MLSLQTANIAWDIPDTRSDGGTADDLVRYSDPSIQFITLIQPVGLRSACLGGVEVVLTSS